MGELRVRAFYLDDTDGGDRWTPVATAANARRAAEDSSTIGYIGELDSGATRISMPITNQAEIAQISPGASAVDLTRETAFADPDRYRPSGEQTFARVVPADDVQARAAALLAERLGARQVAVSLDGSRFGELLVDEFNEEMPARGLLGTTASAGAYDVAFYAGADGDAFRATAIGASSAPLIASDAVRSEAERVCGELRAPIYLISPFRPPPARFAGSAPATAYGYEAMALLLDAIKRAGGDGDSREAVIDELLSTHERNSPIGEYSLEGGGDTSLDVVGVYALRECRLRPGRDLRAP